ncbi:MBL fold metallo-hydrolase [Clostridium oceanicum]|uniref:MBL fold metallo-hydrolase n=1 Tax=Clostridium oceanicum TaxID=1543 RepID=A0ABP3UP33_9CLOT
MKFKPINWIICAISIILIISILNTIDTSNMNAFTNSNGIEVNFLDVGQSDCTLIKSNDKNYMIDSGREEYSDKIINYTQLSRVKKIDEFILTHYHDDHYGGLEELLKNNKIKKILLPDYDSKEKNKVLSIIKKYNVEIKFIKRGWKEKSKKIYLEAIGPLKKYDNENDNSIVLYGKIDSVRYIFSGDCEKRAEKDMINNKVLKKCDILKVPHHGLNTSTTEEFLKITKPKIAIINCDGIYTPQNKVIDRLKNKGVNIIQTSECGDIVIKNRKIKFIK